MKSNKLERIARLLSNDDLQDKGKDNVQFCIADEFEPSDISIEVDGVGLMTLPVSNACVQNLINIASKAKFGLREKTILDENVRNSYEITSDKLRVTINEHSLTAMLGNMRNSLGLDKSSVLTAHLHNMLIYGPGMFFERHQDSEKLENMVASLVVVLPSPHIGGDLIIEHKKKNHIFSSENINRSNVKCISFYADCYHKVEKIKDGYRIALTYNLVLKPEETCNTDSVILNPELTDAVKYYFDIDVDRCQQNQLRQYKTPQPHKLVYFLNHSYTEHSLRWNMLKGGDRASASALKLVAEKLSLISHLALVEIHECWSTCPSYDYDRYRHRNKYDSDPSTDEDEDDPELQDLIEDEVTLSYWIDSNGQKVTFDECQIENDEICWTKETNSFEPYNKEYEDYTGNAGNTMDYWYRRAAVVLWSESSQIPMNFKLNYDNALSELKVLTSSPGNETTVTEILGKAGKYLHKTHHNNDKNYFETLANIVLYIKEKDIALTILSCFDWDILNCDIVQLFAKLQIQYGIDWCVNLVQSWKSQQRYSKDFSIKEIHVFALNFISYGGAASFVEMLLDIQTNTLMDVSQGAYKWWLKEYMPKKIEMFYQTLQACAIVNNTSVVDKIIQHLISNPKLYPVTNLAKLYFKLQNVVPPEFFITYNVLRSHLVIIINSSLALKMRRYDDWSIDAKFQCSCMHCTVAICFLNSKTAKRKIWPLPKAARDHITKQFKSLNLPVELSIERTGSPHKLVLEKTELLYKNANKGSDELKYYQQKLQVDVKDIKPAMM